MTLGVLSLFAAIGMLIAGCRPNTLGQSGSTWGRGTTGSAATRDAAWSVPATIVALGDSYSSGEGNAPYDEDAPGCDRGAGAWPRLLGQWEPGTTVKVIACAGATTGAFTSAYKGQPSQLDALRSLEAAGTKPSVVTITIGGNDAGFSSTLVSCVVFKCFWTGQDTDTVAFIEDTLPAKLTSVYRQVKAAAPGARVVVIGYPTLVGSWGSSNTCTWLRGTNRSELAAVNGDINAVIQRSARAAGVGYVSLANTFRGHGLCTSDSWLYPIGLNVAGPTASAHPNEAGQQAIAGAVYSSLQSTR
jgi:lysophospholipase L1-like esterase